MMTPAKIPKALIGIIGLKALAKKATDVVLEVTAIALTDLLQAYAILSFLSSLKNLGATFSLYLHASINTNISSAAMPRTIKIAKLCRLEKYVILNIPSVMQTVTEKLKRIIEMPMKARNKDLRCMMKYMNTKITEKIA